MNWKFLDVYRSPEYTITRAVSDWGDTCSAGTNSDGPMGFQFLAKGAVRVLDRDANFYQDYSAGEQLTAPPDAAPWAKQCVILVSKESTDYWCIRSTPFPTESLRGTIYNLSAGETFSVDSQNFVVAKGVLRNGNDILYPRSVQVNATISYTVVEDAMVVEFD
jgi:hypothetical protein